VIKVPHAAGDFDHEIPSFRTQISFESTYLPFRIVHVQSKFSGGKPSQKFSKNVEIYIKKDSAGGKSPVAGGQDPQTPTHVHVCPSQVSKYNLLLLRKSSSFKQYQFYSLKVHSKKL